MTLTLSGLVAGRGGEATSAPVDLVLHEGAALIVTGANGAGKSTLLRTIAGLIPPLAGRTSVEGALAPDGEPARHPREIAHLLGHRNALRADSRLGAELAFWHGFLGGAREERIDAVEAALRAVGLGGLSSLDVGHLSAGQQRRAALARLLVLHRPLWLLDEPTAALDTAGQALFARLASAHLSAGGLVVAATHQPLGLDGLSLHLGAPARQAA
ncbi:heme ABC exporter ATP-binding protein CcmA [Aureimonas mangrovi]|uniref:heme ABC exporter ATP-binding protein CcmA n=1 Tax=Aureimonas mangrovi TaxID=2758041 RepID=UPI003CCCF7D6